VDECKPLDSGDGGDATGGDGGQGEGLRTGADGRTFGGQGQGWLGREMQIDPRLTLG